MTSVVNSILEHADYFILLVFRVGGLVFASPIFGRINVPAIAKIGLTATLGYLFFTIFPQTTPIEYTTLIGFVLICALELMVGLCLSFVTNIFFALTAYTAGQLIDMQLGYGIVSVYDAQNSTQAPVMGNVLNLILLIVFFAEEGHLKLIEVLYMTFDRMPVGTLVLSPEIGIVAAELFTKAFLLGVMVALPVLAAGLTMEFILGMLMRTVPQIHMFVVGVPLKMLVGLLVFIATIPVFVGFSTRIFDELFSGVGDMFATFVGG